MLQILLWTSWLRILTDGFAGVLAFVVALIMIRRYRDQGKGNSNTLFYLVIFLLAVCVHKTATVFISIAVLLRLTDLNTFLVVNNTTSTIASVGEAVLFLFLLGIINGHAQERPPSTVSLVDHDPVADIKEAAQ